MRTRPTGHLFTLSMVSLVLSFCFFAGCLTYWRVSGGAQVAIPFGAVCLFWRTGKQFGVPRSVPNGDGWLPSGPSALVLQRFEAVFCVLAHRPKQRLVTVHSWRCRSLFFVGCPVLVLVEDFHLCRKHAGSLIGETSPLRALTSTKGRTNGACLC